MAQVRKSQFMMKRLELYTGLSPAEIEKDLAEKVKILRWMVEKDISDVDEIGKIMVKYYQGKLKME